jgi:hypothetical protein
MSDIDKILKNIINQVEIDNDNGFNKNTMDGFNKNTMGVGEKLDYYKPNNIIYSDINNDTLNKNGLFLKEPENRDIWSRLNEKNLNANLFKDTSNVRVSENLDLNKIFSQFISNFLHTEEGQNILKESVYSFLNNNKILEEMVLNQVASIILKKFK